MCPSCPSSLFQNHALCCRMFLPVLLGLHLAEKVGQPYDLDMVHLEMGRGLGDRTHLESNEAIFAEIGAEWNPAQARGALGKTSRFHHFLGRLGAGC